MKGILKITTVILFTMMLFMGCSKENESLLDNKKIMAVNKENTEEVINGIVKFEDIGFIDISDFTEFDRKEEDINNDGNDEIILFLGKGESLMLDEAYIVICEYPSEKVLTYFEVGPLAVFIGDIKDTTGDKVLDILVESHTGSSDGGESTLFRYNNGEYIESTIPLMSVESNFINGFKYRVKDTISDECFIVDLSEIQKGEYTALGVYEKNGDLGANKLGEYYKSSAGILRDVDNDGIYEYLNQGYMTGSCNADSITSIVETYKYVDGKFVLIDFSGMAGEYGVFID